MFDLRKKKSSLDIDLFSSLFASDDTNYVRTIANLQKLRKLCPFGITSKFQ